MTFQEALYTLGVREHTLSDKEKFRLDQDGFLPFPNLISAELVDRMRSEMEALFALESTGETGYAERVHKHAK